MHNSPAFSFLLLRELLTTAFSPPCHMHFSISVFSKQWLRLWKHFSVLANVYIHSQLKPAFQHVPKSHRTDKLSRSIRPVSAGCFSPAAAARTYFTEKPTSQSNSWSRFPASPGNGAASAMFWPHLQPVCWERNVEAHPFQRTSIDGLLRESSNLHNHMNTNLPLLCIALFTSIDESGYGTIPGDEYIEPSSRYIWNV